MTNDEIFDRLCSLLPAQFETLLLRARVPSEFVSSAVAPQATRAGELLRWMAQADAHGDRVRAALAAMLGVPVPAPPPRMPQPSPSVAPAAGVGARTILFLAAEPTDAGRIRVGRELEEIRERLRVQAALGSLRLESRASVRIGDWSQALHDVRPSLVHFSGHGAPARRRICVEGEDGKSRQIAPDALEALFRLFPEVEGVVLNACYSDVQAEALAHCVPHVVGVSGTIKDKAAIAFSVGFYKALAAGRSVPEAHQFGCVEARLHGVPERLTPLLITRGAAAVPKPATPNKRRTPR